MTAILDASEIQEHSDTFHSMGGGAEFISKGKLIEALQARGLATTYAGRIFDRMGARHEDTQLSLAQYIQYAHGARLEHLAAFQRISHGKATISKDDLRDGLAALHLESRHIDSDALFAEIHHSLQGEITFSEFERHFALLQLDDISHMSYKETYAMFDGGSVALMMDYSRLAKWGQHWLASVFGISASTPTSTATPELKPAAASASKEYDFYVRMATAGIAGGCAQTCVNPMETIKVRLQNEGLSAVKKYKTFFNGGMVIFREEGVGGLWKGTSPAIMRELVYTSSRMGLYLPIKTQVHAWKLAAGGKPGPETIIEKLAAGGTAGGAAAFIGSPADLIKARMQSDTNAQGAKGFAAHVQGIIKVHGVGGLWTGASATVARAVILGSVKMATYDEAKGKISQALQCKPGDVKVTVLGSIFSSYCLTLACAPIDLVRTRVMSHDPAMGPQPGVLKTFASVVGKEGPTGLYRGFYCLWARNAPYNVLQFLIWERLCAAANISIT